MNSYWPLLYVFLLSSCITGLLIKPALAWGWVDLPSTRKHHPHPVPVIGGVTMYAAFCASLWWIPDRHEGFAALMAGMLVMVLIGAYDDRRHIRPSVRLALQTTVVLAAALAGGPRVTDLGDLLGWGPIALAGLALPFTLFGVVGVINAFNMIDGLDGLAGGLALIAAGWLAVLCLTGPAPNPTSAYLLLTLVMVLAGFLAWNLRHPWRKKAKVFMGDAGSTLLGFALGWFIIDLSQGGQAVMAPITALWIMALPLMDTITVMIRRLRAGQSPFAGDRQHLHHLLLATGRTDARVTAILLVCGLMTGGIGAAAWWLGLPEYLQFYAFSAIFLLYYQGTTRLWYRRKVGKIDPGSQPDRRQDKSRLEQIPRKTPL
jgi:UDP-GlcNAc:undecaprenyl-phosphate GlcNAc-1-phosphate transferase